jgi:hypothetical protein
VNAIVVLISSTVAPRAFIVIGTSLDSRYETGAREVMTER